MAASVAMAVPQMPMKWIVDLLNRGLFNNEERPGARHHAAPNAERKRQGGPDRMARGKADQHRAREIAEQIRHGAASRGLARRLDATGKLADYHSGGVFEEARLTELRHHAIEAVGPLIDFL